MTMLRDVIDDKRYKTKRWKDTRLRVLRRDGYRCWVQGCTEYANVCDHITPSTLAMPDHEFYSMSNLRASCKRHNTARGVAARLDREMREGMAPGSQGVRTPVLVRSSGFFRGAVDRDRPLASSTHTGTQRNYPRLVAERRKAART